MPDFAHIINIILLVIIAIPSDHTCGAGKIICANAGSTSNNFTGSLQEDIWGGGFALSAGRVGN